MTDDPHNLRGHDRKMMLLEAEAMRKTLAEVTRERDAMAELVHECIGWDEEAIGGIELGAAIAKYRQGAKKPLPLPDTGEGIPAAPYRVRLPNAVSSDLHFCLPTITAPPGEYPANTNAQGAVWIMLPDGKGLGVKTGEYEWIVAPPDTTLRYSQSQLDAAVQAEREACIQAFADIFGANAYGVHQAKKAIKARSELPQEKPHGPS